MIKSNLFEQDFKRGADPYWPKWNQRWWKLALLLELKELNSLPEAVLEDFVQELDTHYLHHFPLIESELPVGCDPYRQILCHCALGTAAQVLLAGGINVWERLPWLYDWLWRYQLPDGGYNCDEQAYTNSQKSSIVSTVPVLEALLASRPAADFTQSEQELLIAGYHYLLNHQLFRSSTGKLIDEAWLQPLFPRFYEYDLLRGLQLVIHLSSALNQVLPAEAVAEAISRLQNLTRDGELKVQHWYPGDHSTLAEGPEGWQRGIVAERFALLDQAIESGGEYISLQWQQVQAQLVDLAKRGLWLAPNSDWAESASNV